MKLINISIIWYIYLFLCETTKVLCFSKFQFYVLHNYTVLTSLITMLYFRFAYLIHPYRQWYGFSSSHVQMWELDHTENWALKNWCFLTAVLERTTRRSNQLILKEINLNYSLEGLMLKRKLQYFHHLMQRTDSLGKTWCWERLQTKEEWGGIRWDGWIASLT